MWNVNADVNEITNKFFDNYFGPASTAMRKYFNELLAQCQAQKSVIGYDANPMNGDRLKTKFWSQSQLTTWLSYIEEAYTAIDALVETDVDRYNVLYERINRESIAIRYLKIRLYPNSCTETEKKYFKDDVLSLGFTDLGYRCDFEDTVAANGNVVKGLWTLIGV